MKKTLLILFYPIVFCCPKSHSQNIPNGDFESWTSVLTFEDPVDWLTINSGAFFQGCSIPVNKTTDAYSGNYAIDMTTILCNSSELNGLASCVFPFTQRPVDLKGYYKCSSPSTNAVIAIYLSKYDPVGDSTIDVGIGYFFPVPTNSYTLFYAPIMYQDTILPDTAVIDLVAGENAGEWLKVDMLSFTMPVTASGELNPLPTSVSVFPNPMNSSAVLTISIAKKIHNAEVKLFDVNGKEIWQKIIPEGEKSVMIQRDNLSAGIYFYQVKNESEIIGTGKVIIQ